MPRGKWQKAVAWACGLLIVIIGAAGIWFSRKWPFTEAAVQRDLQRHVKGRLTIGRFRKTFFPPGFVAGNLQVVYPDGGNLRPLLVARDLTVHGSWHGLLTHTLSKIKVVGLRIEIPQGGEDTLFASGGKSRISSVGEVEFNDSDFQSHALKFFTKQLVLDDVGPSEKIHFRATLLTDKPHGQLSGKGNVGPWKTGDLAAIPISGTYSYSDADLHVFDGLQGILSSSGKFEGNLRQINVAGTTDVPQFHVDGSARAVHFVARFQGVVNTSNADTQLPQVEARVNRTTILASGNVTDVPGEKGKTAHINLAVDQGRVEDLLNYFSEEKHPSMTGAVKLRASAVLPFGHGFLQRIRLTGDFGVAGGQFTNRTTQTPLNDLSASARDKANHEKESKAEEDGQTAISNLRGHVVVRNGNASLSNVAFEFPGAFAGMEGTFNLLTKDVDIRGTLQTTGTLSQAASGFKAMMLKVATPFLKKKNETVVPFSITGKSSNPKVALDLKRKVKY